MLDKLRALYYSNERRSSMADSIWTRRLFLAVQRGNIKMVERSLKMGANINALRYARKYEISLSDNQKCYRQLFVSPLVVAAHYRETANNQHDYDDVMRYLLAWPMLNLGAIMVTFDKIRTYQSADKYYLSQKKSMVSLSDILVKDSFSDYLSLTAKKNLKKLSSHFTKFSFLSRGENRSLELK